MISSRTFFFFKLYIIVLVLPNIKMNPPEVGLLMVLCFIFKSWIHFEVWMCYKKVVSFHSFICRCPVFPKLFVEGTVFSPLYIFDSGRKWRGTQKPLDEGESGEWKSWLKAQHSENEDHGIQSHHFMENLWRNSGNSVRLYFSGLQNQCKWWLQPWN